MANLYKIWLHVEEHPEDGEPVDLMNTHQMEPVSVGAACSKEEMEKRMVELDYMYGEWP